MKKILKNFISDKGLMLRVAALAYALINQFLVAAGYSPLPFAEAEVEQFVSMALTMFATVWIGYKNNNFTDEAKEAQQVLNEKKQNK